MKTIGDILPLSTKYLQERGIAPARRHAEEILAFALGVKRIDLYLRFDYPLQEEELAKSRWLLKRRAQGEPLEYLLGKVHFFGCDLEVRPSVLIPRVETEILLAKVCERLEMGDLSGKRAWDLCTGSGCLGIGLKKKFPELEVSLSDLSSEAIALARINAEKNSTAVQFYLGDLLAPFKGQRADFVLCNPPYVSKKEYDQLDPSVKNFEPSVALLAEEEGFAFYRRLAKELPEFLNPEALVFLEVGSGQGSRVADCFSSSIWKVKRLEKDWAGHDRFFFLEFE